MKSLTTPDFWEAYAALPPAIKTQAKKTYQIWISDRFYPSLHFKKVNQNLWSIRINREYRALAIKDGDDYYWFWIGLHDEYERLIDES
ncbi:MAG: hypothetical protein ACOYN8_03355 [Pseudanabaena sp.]